MAKPKIQTTPDPVKVGDFVEVKLLVDGDDDLGDVTFNLNYGRVTSAVELAGARKGAFYAQSEGPYAVSFTDAAGKVLAKATVKNAE